jgi:Domain of unknown function (DUF5979)/Thioester domain
VAGAVAIIAVLVLGASAGWALFTPGPPPPGGPRGGTSSEMIMSGTGNGGGVDGFIGPPGSVSDPSVPYPSAPPAGFTPHPEGFAGIIHGTTTDGTNTQLSLYCINILTLTYGGVGYNLGTWDASNVHNVGFVAYLLNHYFPNVPTAPAGLANDDQRAAAVQASIWYFSDNYVLSTTDPLRPAVAAIVEDARTNGPLVQPPPPNLQIAPATATGPIGAPLGPYTVTSPQAPAVVSSTAAMFADAAGTTPIANGTPVANGTPIWLEQATIGGATLSATASAVVPSGNVYLYSGNLNGVTDAQRLILAQDTTVTTTVSAAAQFIDTGALVVTKTIAGPGAGAQGDVTIGVTCNGTALADFVVPAGSTGTFTHTYDDIPTPATCTITENADGANASVTVVTVNGSQTVDLPNDATADNPVDAQPITDTYDPVPVAPTVPSEAAAAAAVTTGTPSAEGALAFTGDNNRPTILAALAALLAGALLVVLARTRRTR